jgi:predicted transcriptional regulator
METNVQLQGELQSQIMSALWKIDHGTVEQVRSALPPRYRSAYTTVQTVLNRLATRGMLVRKKAGNAIVYKPAFSEAEINDSRSGARGSDARSKRIAS